MQNLKTPLIVVVLLLLVVSYSVKAKAGLWDYTVHVEKQTEDFNNARTSAIKDNREAALESVIDRFILLSDFRIVSKLLDADTAYFFEDKLRLSNETVANDIYSVDITYYFNKDKILAFLNKSGIPYATSLKNKILFIPIFNAAINDNNIWNKLWANINNGDYLTNIILLTNLTKIDTAKILAKDSTYLQQLKSDYNVDDIVLAEININNNQTDINADTANKATNNAISGVANTNAVTTNTAANSDFFAGPYYLRITSVNNNTYQDFDNLLSLYDALRFTIGFSEMDTKNKIISVLEQKDSMVFKVHYNSFVDWVAIYNYLKQIPQVEDIYLNEIGNNYAIIKVKYHGNLDDIIKNAATRNIIIDTAELSITCKGFCY